MRALRGCEGPGARVSGAESAGSGPLLARPPTCGAASGSRARPPRAAKSGPSRSGAAERAEPRRGSTRSVAANGGARGRGRVAPVGRAQPPAPLATGPPVTGPARSPTSPAQAPSRRRRRAWTWWAWGGGMPHPRTAGPGAAPGNQARPPPRGGAPRGLPPGEPGLSGLAPEFPLQEPRALEAGGGGSGESTCNYVLWKSPGVLWERRGLEGL